MSKSSEAKKRKEELFYKPTHMAKKLPAEEKDAVNAFAEGYKAYLAEGKIERESVRYFKERAVSCGYEPYDSSKTYAPGDKVYFINREKCILLTTFGKKSVAEGVRFIASHIDSPRLDLKPNPLYEQDEIALFKTHYYGGIRKYQWGTIPLALHGVVLLKDGTKVTVNIGEADSDPKFVITDLLPHLSAEQNKRSLAQGLKGEELNVVVGSLPFNEDKESESVKLNILHLLNEKYGMVEEDFMSAELEVVPAVKPTDIGFDRSIIGAYGHDDKVCAYPAAVANYELKIPEYTCITVLTDKEEIGSVGNTGLQANYLKHFIYDLADSAGVPGRTVLRNSECLSADVTAALDPTFPDVSERRNAAYLNKGVSFCKYTGARGKSGASDANAEFFAKIRGIMNEAGVTYQCSELGKVDEGGGGTVAMYVADMDVDVIDIGTPVLCMHSPFELISKLDLYSTYQAFAAFYNSGK